MGLALGEGVSEGLGESSPEAFGLSTHSSTRRTHLPNLPAPPTQPTHLPTLVSQPEGPFHNIKSSPEPTLCFIILALTT